MVEETAVIEQQMEETRKSLAEKVEALEKQVTATVHDTTQAVNQTVEAVTSTVQDTVSGVTETVQKTVEAVKETFSLSRQVEQRPWLCVGGAVTLGYLLGAFLLPRSSERQAEDQDTSHEPEPEPAQAYEEPVARAPEPTHGEHQVPNWLGGLGDTLDKLRGLAVGTTTGVLGEMVRSFLPTSVQGEVANVFERLTSSLGGTPIKPHS